MPVTAKIIICSVLLGFSLCFILSALRAKRQQQERENERQTIKSLQDKILTVLEDAPCTDSSNTFNQTLKNATLTTDFQLPRLQAQAKIHQAPPEKYKILQKLASQGMGADEIATILGISRIEAGQLITLCNMADYRNDQLIQA